MSTFALVHDLLIVEIPVITTIVGARINHVVRRGHRETNAKLDRTSTETMHTVKAAEITIQRQEVAIAELHNVMGMLAKRKERD